MRRKRRGKVRAEDFRRLGLPLRESRATVIRRAAGELAASLLARADSPRGGGDQEELARILASTYRLLDPLRRSQMLERVHLLRTDPTPLRRSLLTPPPGRLQSGYPESPGSEGGTGRSASLAGVLEDDDEDTAENHWLFSALAELESLAPNPPRPRWEPSELELPPELVAPPVRLEAVDAMDRYRRRRGSGIQRMRGFLILGGLLGMVLLALLGVGLRGSLGPSPTNRAARIPAPTSAGTSPTETPTPAAPAPKRSPVTRSPVAGTPAAGSPAAGAPFAGETPFPAPAAPSAKSLPTAASAGSGLPAAADPTAADPTAADPTAADPTAVDPTAADPTAADPTAVDPTAVDLSSPLGRSLFPIAPDFEGNADSEKESVAEVANESWPSQPEVERLMKAAAPVPDAQDRAAAIEQLDEALPGFRRGSITGGEMLAAAWDLASEEEWGSATRYFWMYQVLERGVLAGELRWAYERTISFEKDFQLPPLDLALQLAQSSLQQAVTQGEHRRVIEWSIRWSDLAISAGEDRVAEQFLFCGTKGLQGLEENKDLGERVRLRRTAIQEWGRSIESIERMRAEKQSSQLVRGEGGLVGRYLCFYRRQWEEGLPWLAASRETDVVELCKREVGPWSDHLTAGQRQEIASGWIDLASKSKGLAAESIRLHARDLLRVAQRDATGKTRQEIEDQLSGLEESLPADIRPWQNESEQP